VPIASIGGGGHAKKKKGLGVPSGDLEKGRGSPEKKHETKRIG